MIETYTLFRARTHRQALQKQGRVVQAEDLQKNQSLINELWESFVRNELL